MACEPYTSSGREEEEEEEGRRQAGCVRTACLLHCCHIPLPVVAIARGVRRGATMYGTREAHGIGTAR